VVVMKWRRSPVDPDCLRAMAGWLFGFLVVDLALEWLEIVSMMYESEESWPAVRELITHKIAFSFFGIQIVLGALLPLLGLGLLWVLNLAEGTRNRLIFLGAVLVLVGIFAMRWNVVIGGQLLSKSLRGFLSYSPPLGGQEGILAAAVVLALPLVLLTILTYFLPPWHEPAVPTPVEPVPTPFGEWRTR